MELRAMINPQLATNILSGGPALFTAITYLALAFAEGIGAIDPIAIWEKFGISGLAGIALFMALRWLLKDRERLEKKIEAMHEERKADTEKRIAETDRKFDQLHSQLQQVLQRDK